MNAASISKVYQSLPKIACKGLCQECCGPIMFSQAEANQMHAHGVEPPGFDETFTCTALKDGRCSIYEDRPYICRLWGAIKKLRCPHGCVPERWVTPEEDRANQAALGPLVPEHQAILESLANMKPNPKENPTCDT